jgi:hypothetical protein
MTYRSMNATKNALESVGSWIWDERADVYLEGPPPSAGWSGLLVLEDQGGG